MLARSWIETSGHAFEEIVEASPPKHWSHRFTPRRFRYLPVILLVSVLLGSATWIGCDSAALVPQDGGEDGLDEPTLPGDDGGSAGDQSDPGADPSTTCDPQALEINERGLLDVGIAVEEIRLAACTRDRWVFVAPTGSTLEVRLTTRGPHLLLASLHYPDAPEWDQRIGALFTAAGLPGTIDFSPPRSGEFFLQVHSFDPEVESVYDLQIVCDAGCDLQTTRFPIVLVHGWMGWDEIGPIEYFYNVPETLEENGFGIFVASLDPYNSVEVRSAQLAEQLDAFLEEGRARKVNIIAHSQGCLDSRRVISTLGYGDRTSALVSVAGPHQGTPIADIALGLLPGPAEQVLAFLLNLLGATGGNESDALASMQSLTSQYVQDEFNPANPDDQRVTYISWTGLTCPLGIRCGDICDIEISLAYDLVYLAAGDNDGLIPVSSAPWGDFRGTVPADHFDEIGQSLGITGPNFDHIEFYLGLARDLMDEGH